MHHHSRLFPVLDAESEFIVVQKRKVDDRLDADALKTRGAGERQTFRSVVALTILSGNANE